MALYSKHFYHRLTESYIAVFGSLFDDISIVKYRSDGTEQKRDRVVLEHSPKEKFIQKLRQDYTLGATTADGERRADAITLPVMSFELESFEYDTQRKTAAMRKIKFEDSGPEKGFTYSPVPYRLNFVLSVYTKTLTEMYQIIEQIIPFFTPDYTVTIHPFQSAPDIAIDLPFSITSVVPSDSYEGSFDDNRLIIWTLSFSAPVPFFGPERKGKRIFRTITSLNTLDPTHRLNTWEGVPEQEGQASPEEINTNEAWRYVVTEVVDDI